MTVLRSTVLCAAFFLVGAGVSYMLPASDQIDVTCRPTDPAKVPHEHAVLFWGNSLAFDHDWRFADHLVVNCARQGMTLESASARMAQLPQMGFDAVILVFGSVELVQGHVDMDRFQDNMRSVVAQTIAMYPDAEVIILGVPIHASAPEIWLYGGSTSVDQINVMLEGLQETTFIDVATLLAQQAPASATYDGVHLSGASYTLLERVLSDQIKQR